MAAHVDAAPARRPRDHVHDGRDAEYQCPRGASTVAASVKDLPSDKKMLDDVRRAAKLHESGAPARPRPSVKKPAAVEVPADLAAALKKDKAAAKTFEGFSPSCRREYVEWITEAKREETRAKRLATTLEWLAALVGISAVLMLASLGAFKKTMA
jgi:hypothetical protein